MISGLLAVMRDVGQLPELPVLREMGTEVTAVLAGERCCRCCRILGVGMCGRARYEQTVLPMLPDFDVEGA